MTIFIRTGLFVAGYFLCFSANAFDVAQEFSAEAVQSIPGRPSMNVKMFISKKAVRTESKMNGNTLTEIVYPKEKRRILLNQLRKTYIEQKAQSNNAINAKKTSSSPCANILNATCKKLDKEKINGRDAIKWEMTVKRNGKDFKSLHWLDKKYHMPLREQFSDGTVSSMIMSGKEKMNGRNTEKWELLATRPNGQSIKSQQWYDPKLKMVIRETLPGGYVRELRKIKVAKQKKSLFKIPSDYKKEGAQGIMPLDRMNQRQMVNPGRAR
ncbi:MAG: DUF4412 domain-containing protein [Woeseiaceae bacterium]